jgi:histidyl-tRNA synthetase
VGRARFSLLPQQGEGKKHRLPRRFSADTNASMKDKPKKPQKLRARLPRGLEDRGPAEIYATRQMVETIRTVYERYGFEPVETPAFEYTDALGKFLPDQDRPNEGVFSFQDDDEQWISLRYDLTAPLARYVAENFDTLPRPYRSYRFGWVFRNEKPGPGRFRQFMQFDADTVGSASPIADAEMCMMAADTMKALGIPDNAYVVKVWNRQMLDGILDVAPVVDGSQRLRALRAIDKRDRLGIHAVQQLLGHGRKDESGDFTAGVGLPPSANNFITISSSNAWSPSVLQSFSSEHLLPSSLVSEIEASDRQPFNFDAYEHKLSVYLAGNAPPPSIRLGLASLRAIQTFVAASGYANRIKIDPSIVRGLEYYTGPVFEVELTFETTDEKGNAVRFGSVGGGGRYDGLISRFRGEAVPATGFSIGVSRLQAALATLKKSDALPIYGPVVVLIMDREEVGRYQRFVMLLRHAGIPAELYLGNPKNSLGAQFKYADRRNSPCVVIQGSAERDSLRGEPVVVIKDLLLGRTAAQRSSDDRDKYLQQQMAAQLTVPEGQLVQAVISVLKNHDVTWS